MFFNKYPYTDMHEINLDWIISEIKKLHHDWEDFKILNSIRFYGEHDITKGYPAWSLVSHDNIGYISTQIVPAGIDLTNIDYWKPVADYSSLLADMQERVVELEKYSVRGSNIYTVDKGGKGDFTSIMDAINTVNIENTNVVIYVMAGTYDEELVFINKCYNLSIIGIGYVVVTHNSIYPNAPLFMAGNNLIVQNIHFVCNGSSYACHIEAQTDGYNIPTTMRIKNCEFVSTNYHALGAGLGPNYDIVFEDCVFNAIGIGLSDGIQPIHVHNFPNDANNQAFRIWNCQLYGSDKYAIEVSDLSEYLSSGHHSYMTVNFRGVTSANRRVLFTQNYSVKYAKIIPNNHITLETDSINTLYGLDYELSQNVIAQPTPTSDGMLPLQFDVSGYAISDEYSHIFVPFKNASIYNVVDCSVTVAGTPTTGNILNTLSHGFLISANGMAQGSGNNKYELKLQLKFS